MTAVAFDTHAQIKQLVQTGVPEAQAEAFVNIVAGATVLPDVSQLTTRADLALLKSDLAIVETSLRGEIKALEANLKGELKGLQGKLDGIEGRLVWWILGAVGVTAVIPQIVPHLPK